MGVLTARTSSRTARASWPWSLALLLLVLAVWETASRAGWVSARKLPPASEVAVAFVQLLGDKFFYEESLSTLRVIALGAGSAIVGGFLLALSLTFFALVRSAVYPVIVGLDVIPKIALIPLFVILFGFGDTAKVVMVGLVTFFPVFLATLNGLARVDEDGRDLLRTMGSGRFQILWMYELPSAAPTIFAGVKISITVAFIAAIISEFMVRNSGLGHLIITFRASLQVDRMMAAAIAVAAIGAVIFFGVEEFERRLIFWNQASPAVGASSPQEKS